VESRLAAVHSKHKHAFLKVNRIFTRTHHHSRCSECLLSVLKHTSSLLKILFDTSMSSLTRDVIVSQMLCLSSCNMRELFEYTLLFPVWRSCRPQSAACCYLFRHLISNINGIISNVCCSTILHKITMSFVIP
jgi:hypothetical protein